MVVEVKKAPMLIVKESPMKCWNLAAVIGGKLSRSGHLCGLAMGSEVGRLELLAEGIAVLGIWVELPCLGRMGTVISVCSEC
jgi:hypothetical protein